MNAHFANRIVIKAGRSRTIVIDVQDDVLGEPDCDDGDGEQQLVEFSLRGYDAGVTHTQEMLDEEIEPFIDALVDAVQDGIKSQNFSVAIGMNSPNPFLNFYLKDVPTASVKDFRLDLNDMYAGDPVRVVVRQDGLHVAARKPSSLVKSTKAYLVTPALSHRRRR